MEFIPLSLTKNDLTEFVKNNISKYPQFYNVDNKITFPIFTKNPFVFLLDKYKEKHRYYHNESHLTEVNNLIFYLNQIEAISKEEEEKLYIISFFHDAIYNPKAFDNEEKSALLFLDTIVSEYNFDLNKSVNEKFSFLETKSKYFVDIVEIYQSILDTKDHSPSSRVSEIFCEIDMFCLTNYNLVELIEYENKIFKEYQFYDYVLYHEKRLEFLKSCISVDSVEIVYLIDHLKSRTIKIGLYAGSFNPFHVGHLDILNKAEKVFDKVIICKGTNPEKSITQLNTNSDVISYREIKYFNTYLVDFISELNATAREYELKNNLNRIVEYYIVKGLRNHNDFDFESNQFKYSTNFAKEKSVNFDTVLFFSDTEFQHISSSDIRNMEKLKPGSAKKLII